MQSDAINAKSMKVSATHSKQLNALEVVRSSEGKARREVEQREGRFWREVARASATRISEKRTSGGVDSYAMARLADAHKLLKEAKAKHAVISGELRVKVNHLLKTKATLNELSAVQRKARLKREYQLSDRRDEEVQELQAVRGGRSNERPINHALVAIKDSESIPIERSMTKVEIVADLSLHDLYSGNQSDLRMAIDYRGEPVECALAADPSGAVSVVLNANTGELVERMTSARYHILANLRDQGIKVSSLDVRQESFGGAIGYKAKRAYRQELDGDDENVIS